MFEAAVPTAGRSSGVSRIPSVRPRDGPTASHGSIRQSEIRDVGLPTHRSHRGTRVLSVIKSGASDQ